ncbi:ferric reductase like transmembrane component-domain-containing protein [Pyronema omphalodes]|nr:ferric reductase like transmembrane component-domain-containing protein [Pyronema omphalodes]KAI5817989.1 ferric reductase like transmembrane component-domain-containing protein [Pyronema omphalodes]
MARHSLSTVVVVVVALALVYAQTVVAAGGGGGKPPSKEELDSVKRNIDFTKWLYYALGAFAVLPFLHRFVNVLYSQVRLLVSLNRENQRYFATQSSEWIPWLKKHMLYSPLFRNRHNREFQLSEAINVGTLPTRFQTFFLVGYVASNNRTGVMATVNMVPLFLMAGRNNPLIALLGISFDTFNLVHRWLGRIVVIEAVVHTLAWMVGKVDLYGWETVRVSITSSAFIMPGFIATVAFCFLLFHSPSVIRHAFYESFLLMHILAAATACAGLWYHLSYKPDMAHWLSYLKSAIILWGLDRFLRLARLVYRNMGRKMTRIHVEALPGDAVRVTIRMARPWKLKPGEHLYLYVPTLGLWTSHPFTIAWQEDEAAHFEDDGTEKSLPVTRQDVIQADPTMSLIVRRRTGFTNTLFKKAFDAPRRCFDTMALVEGPYGKGNGLGSYGTVVMVAGGVGITHPVTYLKDLVEGFANGTVATRRVTLVWVLQTPANFNTLLNMELDQQMGAMAVTVCGGGSLSDDVRAAVRAVQSRGNVDFVEEAFSW